MNIEDLTKTQLLLLTILVNFVTSIATGVLTVSLLDQAPPTVIQTVNRIVDHTIETVTTEVPVIRNTPAQAPSSEDLLTNAVAEASARSVLILRNGSAVIIGRGVFVPATRSVFTSGNLTGTVRVQFSDGTTAEATSAGTDGTLRRYEFAADAVLPQVTNASFVPSAQLKLGQTAIALSSEGGAVTGIISRVADMVYTDLPGVPEGMAAVNLSGDIIGLSLGDGRLIPADRLAALMASE